jgi:tetraacyldisaccharide 4'-kinase
MPQQRPANRDDLRLANGSLAVFATAHFSPETRHLNPLSSIYGMAAGARNALYDRQLLSIKRLQGPVVSVGNLSVGGSGKTPFVILLGELLKTRGIRFDVLSRGYGRQTRGVLLVDPAGSSRDFGDEPLLIARRLEIPVVLGENRYQAGILAEKKFGSQLHLLDDGFQHRALARDFDIVLVTAEDARDQLLPAGRLREPAGALHRADAIVLTAGAAPEQFPVDRKLVWRVRRGIVPQNVPPKPVAFCGIARPQNFMLQLRKAGVEPAVEAVYRDHHAYSENDIRELLALKTQSEAGGFVTTEKDAINLGAYFSALQPIAVVPVKMEFPDAANAVDTVLRIISERKNRA